MKHKLIDVGMIAGGRADSNAFEPQAFGIQRENGDDASLQDELRRDWPSAHRKAQ